MKTFTLFFAILIISISFNNKLSANPQDSCLKLVIPDEPNLGYINPDSVRVDSCIGSPTYGKLFAKKYYYLQFKLNIFPFDSQIHPDSLKRVSDIGSSKAEMKAEFEQLENQFGTIYFQGREYQMDSSDFAKDPGCRLLFEDYQNIEDIIDSFTENISELDTIVYFDIVKILISVDDDNLIFNDAKKVFPNPVNSIIDISSFADMNLESISIYNITGLKVLDTKYSDQIDVSQLQPGTYFIRIGNNSYKFIKLN